MTLQNGIVEGGSVYLYCDSAVFEMDTLRQVGSCPKAIVGLRSPYAITTSFVGVRDLEVTMMSLLRAVDNPSLNTAKDLAVACQKWLQDWQITNTGVARLLIGSNFNTEGPHLVFVPTDDVGFAKPLHAVTVEAYVSSANDSKAYAALAQSHNRRAIMPAMIDAQYATPTIPVGGGSPHFLIGGAVTEIEVTEQGAKSTVIRDWNQEAQL